MPRPAFDHLWRHESYQSPISSDRLSDLTSFRGTGERREGSYKKAKDCLISLIFIILYLKAFKVTI